MNVLLVDISALFWSAWHAGTDKPVSFAFESTVDRVARWASHYSRTVICTDTPPYKRKAISADYKAHRDAPEPAAVEQFRRVKERLDVDGYHVIGADGYEADDVIATLVAQWQLSGDDVRAVDILSGDKDLMQLVTDRVNMLSPRDGKRYGIDEVIEKFGVHPNQMRDLLTLMGDSSDNVPGVPKCGAKTAAKLLMQYGDVDSVVEHAGELTPALSKAVRESAAMLPVSRQLVTLMTDAPVRWETILEEKQRKRLVDTPEDAEFYDDGPPPETPPPTPTPTPAPQSSETAKPQTRQGATTAIVQAAAPASWSLALEPDSIGNAFKLARGLHESRLYSKFQSPEAIMAIIIRGRELGLGALTALDQFHVVEGHPTMHAHLITGLVKAHPACEYFQLVESTETHAIYETKRKGEPGPTRIESTIQDAERAGLTKPTRNGKPSNWTVRPKVMLRKQAAVELARAVYPDVVGGLYDPDEIEGAA